MHWLTQNPPPYKFWRDLWTLPNDVKDVKDYDVEVKSTADVIYGLWVEENHFPENSEFRNNFNSAELLTKKKLYQMKTFINLLIIQIILGRAVESLGMEIC